MKLIRAGAAVLNTTPLDWDGNLRLAREAVAEAQRRSVTLLCLPELALTGYGCEDAFFAPHVQQTAMEQLLALIPGTKGMVVSAGLPVNFRNALYNCAALIADGELLGLFAKQHLAGDGIHYEPRWFKPWPSGARATVALGGREVPIGDLYFSVGGARIGFEICEDAWGADRPGARLARLGVDVLLNPSASHFAFDKIDVRRRFVLEGSRAFGAVYLYSNLLGNEAGRALYDGGALIAESGRMVAEGARFSFREWALTDAVVDLEAGRTQQTRVASFEPETGGPAPIARDFAWPAFPPAPAAPARVAGWEAGSQRKEEEFARAVALGLIDYLRKSRARGFALSLSGGHDSAAVACLIGLMVKFALSELSAAGLRTRLAFIPGLEKCETPAQFVNTLLVTAYQPTRNSSAVTRDAAAAVAAALGARHFVFPVDELAEGYKRIVGEAIGRPLDWKTDDLALQNIQARVRAPAIWLLANLTGALLLTTSNRSEAAVGYATMDGDTAGGLAPIAGIDKAFLRHWMKWLESRGPEGIGPMPEMKCITGQPSTPELRPADAAQKSEGDLMPFPVLDAIERAAIRDKQGPLDAWRRLCALYPEHDGRTLAGFVEKFFTLWCRNQWKRERYAPSFHLDDENLDPKTWCRFPILSGGYARELAELRKAAGI